MKNLLNFTSKKYVLIHFYNNQANWLEKEPLYK